MAANETDISLFTTIKELKKYPYFNRNTLFLLKECGVNDMADILVINPYEFRENKGVGPDTIEDLLAIKRKFGYLINSKKEENAKLLDKAAQICVSKHAGQRDKMGCAYFQHPMRVAMRCRTDEETRALRADFSVIEGLYIAGVENGSLYSRPYYDVGGTCSGLAYSSGRLAGMKMAEYVNNK